MTVTQWHSVNELREELATLLDKTVLKTAVEVLSLKAKARLPTMQVDVTTLALTHAHLAGYQKAIDDLVALAEPPPRGVPQNPKNQNKDPHSEWGYVEPK